MRDFAQRCVRPADEELFRIYCYHCQPYSGTETHPLTGNPTDFSATNTYRAMDRLIRDLEVTDNIAYRAGELSFDGWRVKRQAAQDLIATGRAVRAADFQPDIKQKIVDMKIGLDVAWLSSKRIVDKLILVTADSDFVPAMKFARREGVQVVLVNLGHRLTRRELKVHADELRAVNYP
ncbi:MAG: NYN domain-containing protein [Bacteroidota bacterium]